MLLTVEVETGVGGPIVPPRVEAAIGPAGCLLPLQHRRKAGTDVLTQPRGDLGANRSHPPISDNSLLEALSNPTGLWLLQAPWKVGSSRPAFEEAILALRDRVAGDVEPIEVDSVQRRHREKVLFDGHHSTGSFLEETEGSGLLLAEPGTGKLAQLVCRRLKQVALRLGALGKSNLLQKARNDRRSLVVG